MRTIGTTLFSLTPYWRDGAEPGDLLQRIARAGCGPAVELIGHQSWRGFPDVSAEDERAFRSAIDRLGLTAAALGVYTDLYRRPGVPMSEDDAFEDIRPQLATAARLGFGLVRATLGMAPGLLRRVAAEAERQGVVLTFEVQGNIAPDDPAVLEVADLQQRTGSPWLGLTLDFSLTTPALPASLRTALRRLGLADDEVAQVVAAWQADGPVGVRIGRALGAVAGQPHEAELSMLVAGVLGRCGRQEPAAWAPLMPLVRHAHAKFWDPDVESVRAPHAAWLEALAASGYDGAVVSEWGGHELLDRADADALAVTRAHVALLAELTGASAAVRT